MSPGWKQSGLARVMLLLVVLGWCLPALQAAARGATEAQALMKEGKFAEAAAILAPLAARDDPDALVLFGLLAATGAGVAEDDSAAKERWTRAAHLGQRDAIRLLIPALMDPFQRDWWSEQLAAAPEPAVKLPVNMVRQERAWLAASEKVALAWNEERAAQGDPMALYNLYALHRHDFRWIMQRKEELLAWLRKSALAGYTPALEELAGLYDADPAGIRLPNRLLEPDARQWGIYMRRAAEAGDAHSQLLWAHRLSSGRGGVEKNPELAVEYYRRSSEQGNAYAPYFLFEAYSEGQGVAKNDAIALENLKLAAARDNDTAIAILGRRLTFGQKGVAVDPTAGAEMMQRSLLTSLTPDDDSIYFVAFALLHGRGLPRDAAAAFKWAQWGASKGSAECHHQLGVQYMEGTGVARDDDAGYKSFLAAEKAGSASAKLAVARSQLEGRGTPKDLVAAAAQLEGIRAARQDKSGLAAYLLATLKLGAFGGGQYDLAAGESLLEESARAGYPEARFALAFVRAEAMPADEGAEHLRRTVLAEAAAGSRVARTMLDRFHGDATALVNRLLPLAEEIPSEREISRRISDLGVVPLNAMPRPVYLAAPRYPYLLAGQGQEGQAVVEFIVDNTGRVTETRLISDTHVRFGQAAEAAVKTWRFAPGTKDGRQVATRVSQLIEFRLEPEVEAK